MSHVVSMRLKDEQVKRLERFGRQVGRPLSQGAALLLEEALRQWEFPHVEFRDTGAGRQPYVAGTRLALWLLADLADGYGGDARKVAEHLGEPGWLIEAGLRYIAAYRQEIDAAIEHNEWVAEHLLPTSPGVEVVIADRSQ